MPSSRDFRVRFDLSGQAESPTLRWNLYGTALRRFRFLAVDEPRPMIPPNSGLSLNQQRAALLAQYH